MPPCSYIASQTLKYVDGMAEFKYVITDGFEKIEVDF